SSAVQGLRGVGIPFVNCHAEADRSDRDFHPNPLQVDLVIGSGVYGSIGQHRTLLFKCRVHGYPYSELEFHIELLGQLADLEGKPLGRRPKWILLTVKSGRVDLFFGGQDTQPEPTRWVHSAVSL